MFSGRQACYFIEAMETIASMPLVIASVPLKCFQFPLRVVPFTKEKMPWCPCPFKNEAYRPERVLWELFKDNFHGIMDLWQRTVFNSPGYKLTKMLLFMKGKINSW